MNALRRVCAAVTASQCLPSARSEPQGPHESNKTKRWGDAGSQDLARSHSQPGALAVRAPVRYRVLPSLSTCRTRFSPPNL